MPCPSSLSMPMCKNVQKVTQMQNNRKEGEGHTNNQVVVVVGGGRWGSGKQVRAEAGGGEIEIKCC